ncbi:hypothetical protein MBOU_35850 [Mycobacterium bourgelatii]|uniref:STAS domain-containing protein n=1 Tax=Mycobacterium bourgelatii TaxID=1273442 RepID=A0A7I9YSP1_MYCBU|nr:hypothetical protein MBOU_35850 [Mycobacterium bourgelatii]
MTGDRAAAVRASGIFESARAAGKCDHACLAYSTKSERDAAAVEWLVEGARIGQRLAMVTTDPDGGAELLAALAAADARVAEQVAAFSHDQVYDMSKPIDADAQLALYAGQVKRALADGFTGIRVFCDITPLIADPARRASHAHWEHTADAWMAEGNPLSALCAYDVGVVGNQPEAVMVVHPLRHGPATTSTPFGLFCQPSKTVLGGEVDAFGVRALAEALEVLPDGPVNLDVSDLSYICARGAAALAHAGQVATANRPRIRLTGAPPIVKRIWQVLGFDKDMIPEDASRRLS